MNHNLWSLVRILTNSAITTTPIRVLRELERQGKRRLPNPVQRQVASRRTPGLQTLRFVYRWLRSEHLTRHQGQWVINSFLPPFPGPAFERMFTNLLSGRRLSPVSAYLAITAECPYNCWHCSLKNRRSGHMPTETWLAVIEQLHQLGCSVIGFTGGEPLWREDLATLIRAAHQGGATTILYTCGARFLPERIAELKAAGLWGVCVSYDHPEAKEFDRLRGRPGAAINAQAALRTAKEAGFYTMIGAVTTREFVQNQRYHAILKQARQLGVDEFRLVEPMPTGRLCEAPADLFLDEHMIQQVREFHIRSNRKGTRPKICAFNQIESPELFGCGGGTQHLFIDPAGEVTPCDFTPLSFGTIQNEPLATIWERMNQAMGGAPRRHCFIQQHSHCITAHAGDDSYPLSAEVSQAICHEAGPDGLPDYFQMIMANREKSELIIFAKK